MALVLIIVIVVVIIMWNGELQDIISRDKTVMLGFRGVRAADQLPQRLQTGQSLIINNHDAGEPGQHWMALYQYTADTLEMFDSGGKPPEYYNLQDKLPNAKQTIYNKVKLQGTSDVCGVYCLYYLFYKSRGHPTSKIIDDLFSKDWNNNDLQLIERIKTLYDNI